MIQSIYRAPEIELQWSPSDGFVDKYTVVYNGTPYDTPNNDTKITLYSLTAGTTYDVTITAIRHNRKSQERRDTFTTEVERKSQHLSIIYPKVLSIGTPETINFPFVPNGKLMGLGIPIFRHNYCRYSSEVFGAVHKRKYYIRTDVWDISFLIGNML